MPSEEMEISQTLPNQEKENQRDLSTAVAICLTPPFQQTWVDKENSQYLLSPAFSIELHKLGPHLSFQDLNKCLPSTLSIPCCLDGGGGFLYAWLLPHNKTQFSGNMMPPLIAILPARNKQECPITDRLTTHFRNFIIMDADYNDACRLYK